MPEEWMQALAGSRITKEDQVKNPKVGPETAVAR